MEIDRLVDTARARAGSDDFGEDTWQEGLEVLVRSLTDEAALNEVGEAVVSDQIVGYLVNRLEVERWYARHPEIDEQEIVAPLFGLGLPRTGSTALSFLLALDPNRRSLRNWEAHAPCPPPETATEHTDPRIAEAQAVIDLTNEMYPDFAGMLPSSATGPQECLVVMALDFRSQLFVGMTPVPSYGAWLLDCDMAPAYRYHRRVLKLLQWRCPPRRWWLKSPAHMASIDALDAVYPDARFVMTHRDVAEVLPSVCALFDTFARTVSERRDPDGIGARNVEQWHRAVERLVDFRDRGNDHRFHDLSFAAVQRDPLAEVTKLYAELGDELDDGTRQRMQDWWASSSQQRSAAPRAQRAETFGLDAAAVRERFAAYHDRFGVPVEASADGSAGEGERS